MLFRQMRYFVAVVECGSFTEAAEQCYISQSAISQQIQSLERELGIELIHREKRRFTVTSAGQYFYSHSKTILDQADELIRETKRLGEDRELQLRIGYLRSYSGRELHRAIAEFAGIYPEVSIDIVLSLIHIYRLLDLCCNVSILPQINQIERHPHYQREEELHLMRELGIQPQAWAPFAEGLKGMFAEPALKRIAEKHKKTPAQVILRWNVQQGVIVIPKSVHKDRMEENLDIWNFSLGNEDMDQIAALDKGVPSMLDTRKISEIRRVYDYLNNPVLTSL